MLRILIHPWFIHYIKPLPNGTFSFEHILLSPPTHHEQRLHASIECLLYKNQNTLFPFSNSLINQKYSLFILYIYTPQNTSPTSSKPSLLYSSLLHSSYRKQQWIGYTLPYLWLQYISRRWLHYSSPSTFTSICTIFLAPEISSRHHQWQHRKHPYNSPILQDSQHTQTSGYTQSPSPSSSSRLLHYTSQAHPLSKSRSSRRYDLYTPSNSPAHAVRTTRTEHTRSASRIGLGWNPTPCNRRSTGEWSYRP